MDRTSKIIFALIAAGLWANVMFSAIRPAFAQQDYGYILRQMQRDLSSISGGLCFNRKICG